VLTGLVFRWPADRLPVRYWMAPGVGVVDRFARQAVATWAAQFLYGEFRGALVADSASADVWIFVEPGPPPDVPLTNDPPTGACGGVTSNDYTEDNRLTGPFIVRITWDARFSDTDVVNCLHRVTVHEVGHTLGILAHSPNPLDLMFGFPAVAAPSLADRATIEALYHTTPSLLPPEVPDAP
jgi:predicted Zn-dependent protease